MIVITGSGGLLGSELALRCLCRGDRVIGIDNNSRGEFFGEAASTGKVIEWLKTKPGYTHQHCDIRNSDVVECTIRDNVPSLVINCAAQPAHDYSCDNPIEDFEINTRGALNVLESCRRFAPNAVVVQMSTNKVYGDGVNRLPFVDHGNRYDFRDVDGIDESFPLDGCIHSPYGANKLAADVIAQEYSRYYGMKVGVFRAGCITGERHGAVKLHGFLSYLVKCAVRNEPYTVIGYYGKQVRDQIHSSDLADAILRYADNPVTDAVYNVGGGISNSLSINQAIEAVESRLHKKMAVSFVHEPRRGDHRIYYSDNRKYESAYGTIVHIGLDEIIDRLIADWKSR